MNLDSLTQTLIDSAESEKPKKRLLPKLLFIFFCLLLFLAVFLFGLIWASGELRDAVVRGKFTFPSFRAEESVPEEEHNSGEPYTNLYELCDDVRCSLCAVLPEGYGSSDTEDYGTGVVIGEKGDLLYIASNYHILADKKRITLAFSGSNFMIAADLCGIDKDTDLAVLSVRKSDIPTEALDRIRIASLGDSDAVRQGDLALVIGNPANLQFKDSLSAGVISSTSRSLTLVDANNIGATYVLLQTDAAINPGDSGAPLLNGRGEVIGFCNAGLIALDNEGIYFATPTNTAMPVLEALINYGRMSRPYLGIVGVDCSNWEYYDRFDIPEGVLVYSTSVGGPAELAGIEEYDVLTHFNGQRIKSFDELKALLAQCEIGSTVPVTVYRFADLNEPETFDVNFRISDKSDF